MIPVAPRYLSGLLRYYRKAVVGTFRAGRQTTPYERMQQGCIEGNRAWSITPLVSVVKPSTLAGVRPNLGLYPCVAPGIVRGSRDLAPFSVQ